MSDKQPAGEPSPRDFFNLDMFDFLGQHQTGAGSTEFTQSPQHQYNNAETSDARQKHEADQTQAAMLHQQLEHIHMRSPALFGNGASGSENPQQQRSEVLGSQALLAEMMSGKWTNGNAASSLHGMPTPAQSSEMYPSELHTVMSPMQLGMLGREAGDLNLTPLLSPALTLSSHSTSPAGSAFYHAGQTIPTSTEHQALAQSQQLEQLQLQQRQFQEQLRLLQQQQQQLTSNASPYLANGIQRVQNDTHMPSSSNSSTLNSPSPGYFSPLTSPALGPAPRHSYQHSHSHSQSHNLSQQQAYPLSALSSPALNPIGSSGGAQQTLSPALNPQRNADMASPDYLAALVGMLDNANGSAVVERTPSIHAASPALGPNRHSLPSKSRPSPMMKPTNRTHRNSVSANAPPMSPLVSSNGLSVQQVSSVKSSSTTSTPSPVDLAQMMPPPPVPPSTSVVPMTPASLMNLGGGADKRTARKLAPSPVFAPKRNGGSKIAPAPVTAAKRGLAIRPATGTGRAPPQRVAAAAARNATATQEIPADSRKSSHKVAEQKRRDSLKAGFDELRLLLPPINTEALDPESGEPIPGSSAPRLLPKSSLVPDDNPNRGVSKVALLKYSNEYIGRLQAKIDKRDGYIELLREEVRRVRRLAGVQPDSSGDDDDEDLLNIDMLEGEEEDEGDMPEDGMAPGHHVYLNDGMEDDDDDVEYRVKPSIRRKKSLPSPALGPRRSSAHSASSTTTVTASVHRQNRLGEQDEEMDDQ